jgi:hypothetical protein
MAKLHQFFSDTGYTPDDYRALDKCDRSDAVCGWLADNGVEGADDPEVYCDALDEIEDSIGLVEESDE